MAGDWTIVCPLSGETLYMFLSHEFLEDLDECWKIYETEEGEALEAPAEADVAKAVSVAEGGVADPGARATAIFIHQ